MTLQGGPQPRLQKSCQFRAPKTNPSRTFPTPARLKNANPRFHRKLNKDYASANCGRSFSILNFPEMSKHTVSTLDSSVLGNPSLFTPDATQESGATELNTRAPQQHNRKDKKTEQGQRPDGFTLGPHALGEIQLSSVLNIFLTLLP